MLRGIFAASRSAAQILRFKIGVQDVGKWILDLEVVEVVSAYAVLW